MLFLMRHKGMQQSLKRGGGYFVQDKGPERSDSSGNAESKRDSKERNDLRKDRVVELCAQVSDLGETEMEKKIA